MDRSSRRVVEGSRCQKHHDAVATACILPLLRPLSYHVSLAHLLVLVSPSRSEPFLDGGLVAALELAGLEVLGDEQGTQEDGDDADDAEDDHDTGLALGPALGALGELGHDVADDDAVESRHVEWRGW